MLKIGTEYPESTIVCKESCRRDNQGMKQGPDSVVYVVELLLHGGSNAEKLQVGGVSLQNPNLWLSAVAHRSNSNTQGAEAEGSL